jgi:hypothetical protein
MKHILPAHGPWPWYNNHVSIRINLFLLPIIPPSSLSIVVFFFPVGFSSLTRHFQQKSKYDLLRTTKGLQERTQPIEWDDGET